MFVSFISRSLKHRFAEKLFGYPVEESVNYKLIGQEERFAVADGVTRDPSEWLPTNKLKFAYKYKGNPDAMNAAKIFTSCLDIRKLSNVDPKARAEMFFTLANEDIKGYNDIYMQNPDLLTRWPAGCVGAAAFRGKDYLSIGHICDGGYAIFSPSGELLEKSRYEGPAAHEPLRKNDERMQGLTWENPLARQLIRSTWINNPLDQRSYGVLNGDARAIEYVRTGFFEATPEQIICLFTDGIGELIFKSRKTLTGEDHYADIDGKFVDFLRKKDFRGLEDFLGKRVHTEGTFACSYTTAKA